MKRMCNFQAVVDTTAAVFLIQDFQVKTIGMKGGQPQLIDL